MSEEEIRNIARKSFVENIMTYLDSSLIYTYIQKLEQENKDLKDNYCFCNRTDCSARIKDSKTFDSIQQKYEKEIDNQNKLKEWLKEEDNWDYTPYNEAYIMVDKVLLKMQEIEGDK